MGNCPFGLPNGSKSSSGRTNSHSICLSLADSESPPFDLDHMPNKSRLTCLTNAFTRHETRTVSLVEMLFTCTAVSATLRALYWQDGGDYLLIVCSFAWRKCQYRRNFAGRWTLRWSFMFFRDSRRPRSFPYFVAHRMKLLHLHTLAKVSATLSSPLIMRCDLENTLQVTTPPFRTQSESDRLVCKGKCSPATNWKQKQIGYLFWPSIWTCIAHCFWCTQLYAWYAWS